jgi:hypothetical protein
MGEASRNLDPHKVQICRVDPIEYDNGQPCACPKGTCALWKGGLKSAAAVPESMHIPTDVHTKQAKAEHFAPDWSELDAARESLREHMAMVKELREQLAASGVQGTPKGATVQGMVTRARRIFKVLEANETVPTENVMAVLRDMADALAYGDCSYWCPACYAEVSEPKHLSGVALPAQPKENNHE